MSGIDKECFMIFKGIAAAMGMRIPSQPSSNRQLGEKVISESSVRRGSLVFRTKPPEVIFKAPK